MAKFLELKSEIKFAREYYNRNFVGCYKIQTQCDDVFDHIENLIKVIEDRIEIAEIRAAESPAPEARYWKDILNEYGVIYNLERMYNSTPEIEGGKEENE